MSVGEDDDENKSDDTETTCNVNSTASTSTDTFKIPKNIFSKKRKAEQMQVMESRLNEAYEHLKKAEETPKKDDCSLYGDLLARKLRSLDENTREYAMLEIDKMIYELKQQTRSASNVPYQFQNFNYNSQFSAIPSHPQHTTTFMVPPFCSQSPSTVSQRSYEYSSPSAQASPI